MTTATPPAFAPPRWALSFADLCLVLLAFLLLVHANRGDPAAVGAGIRKAFGSAVPAATVREADAMFVDGEAVLRVAARAELRAIGARAAQAGGAVRVESRGSDGPAHRFDDWELAAARAAAVARAIAAGGLAPDKVDLRVAGTADARAGERQRLTITMAG